MTSEPPAIDWLLGDDNPPVRYLTLRHLLHKPETDAEVKRARSRLMEYKVTQGILRHAAKFRKDPHSYRKYTGLYWQIIFLGQFLADGKDPRIAPGVETVLAEPRWASWEGGQCLVSNILAGLTRLGYGDHPVVREKREALAERIVRMGGLDCTAMAYSLLPGCYMAQPKVLHCLAQVPPADRSPAMKTAIGIVVDNLVRHEVFVYVPGNQDEWLKTIESHPELPEGKTVKSWIAGERERFLKKKGAGTAKPKPGWLKFGFPLHYNSDVLESMVALAELGIPMRPELAKPLEAIRRKQTKDGRWLMESSLNGKMWVDVEEKRKPSKWLTYFALRVLRHFEG